LQDQGLVRHVGFATHGPHEVIIPALETGEFSFVNLHWYYFDQYNWPAIVEASRRDMGVLIISPSDKGGKLYEPPDKLVELCRPLAPMEFNDLFCLARERVHTLTVGAARPSDFDLHGDAVARLDGPEEALAPIRARLEEAVAGCFGRDWAEHWQEGLPLMVHVPDALPLYLILRLYILAKTFDMIEYGRTRYNLLGSGGHWVPGLKVDKVDWGRLSRALGEYRFADRIPNMLREAHELFNTEDQRRLSESGS
jgi:predicted aldo/keto reductase-like oxidoreductase